MRPRALGGSGSDSGGPIGLDLIRERWAERFELVDVTAQLEDIDRVAVTLRKV